MSRDLMSRRTDSRRVTPRCSAGAIVASVALLLAGCGSPDVSPEGKPDPTPSQPQTVVLVVDVSLSMASSDVAPSRLAALRTATAEFARRLPPEDKLGLVSFAGKATVLVAPSTRHEATSEALAKVSLAESTATGDGIYAALNSIAGTRSTLPGSAPDRASIVLVSDGQQTVPFGDGPPGVASLPRSDRSSIPGVTADGPAAGQPRSSDQGTQSEDLPGGAYPAARAAQRQGVPIFAIALGTPTGRISLGDQEIPVPSDEPAAREIARLSGGTHYTAASETQLREAFDRVLARLHP